MPATDPSRKCRFRRSLPHLGTACNLRFFACIHTSAFIKETLRKLDWIRSQLYEQLRRRPRQHFLQNFKLKTLKPIAGAVSSKKRTFRRRAKKARFRTPRMTPVPLHRPLTLVGRVVGISTFSFSKSPGVVPPTAKHTHVYTASS